MSAALITHRMHFGAFPLYAKLTWDINMVASKFPWHLFWSSPNVSDAHMRCSPSLWYLRTSSVQWLFPQLSVPFLLTNRANDQTVKDTPHSLSSIYRLLSIASLYLLVFSSLHLYPPPPPNSSPSKAFIYQHHFRLFYSSLHGRRIEEGGVEK